MDIFIFFAGARLVEEQSRTDVGTNIREEGEKTMTPSKMVEVGKVNKDHGSELGIARDGGALLL